MRTIGPSGPLVGNIQQRKKNTIWKLSFVLSPLPHIFIRRMIILLKRFTKLFCRMIIMGALKINKDFLIWINIDTREKKNIKISPPPPPRVNRRWVNATAALRLYIKKNMQNMHLNNKALFRFCSYTQFWLHVFIYVLNSYVSSFSLCTPMLLMMYQVDDLTY